jgi:hypothetical protein
MNSLKPLSKSDKQEIKYALQDEKANVLREQLDLVSDADLILFAESVYNETLCSLGEYIEDRAYEEEGNNCDF